MQNKGITLVETIVAVTVLTFALGGPFLLAANSLRSAGYAREEITAARLAEEGLEVVHNMRDNNSAVNSLSSRAWDTNISNCYNGGSMRECVVDIRKQQGASNPGFWTDGVTGVLQTCGTTPCPDAQAAIYQNPTTGIYTQNVSGNPGGWVDTTMRRRIRITSPSSKNNREYLVESEVTYYAGGQLRKVRLQDYLMNWFPQLPIH